MQPTQDIAVVLDMPSGEQATASLTVAAVTRADRWSRGYKPALQLFGVGLALALVPLMHVLGPLVLWSAAAILLSRRLQQRARILATALACPKCGGRVDVAEQSERWPIDASCDACRWQVRIDRAAPRSLGRPETGAPSQRV